MVLSRLTANNIVPINEIELLKNLADMTQRIWKQKAQNEEDFGDDFPDDFRGNFSIQINCGSVFSTLSFIKYRRSYLFAIEIRLFYF